MNDKCKEKVFVKKSNCPYCDKSLNSALCSDGSDDKPRCSDYSICFGCMEFLKFDKKLNLVKVNWKRVSLKDRNELLEMKEQFILAKKWYSSLN